MVRHIQELFKHIQAYLEPWSIQNHEYLEREAYAEPWHIYNPAIFRVTIYSERWHIQNPRHIQNSVKHLR